jgi:putative addiction module component (TIGR02574 family)
MNKALLQELLELTPDERLELVEQLWDSIAPEDMPPLTEAQKKELDRRLAEHEKDPSRASTWEEVRSRLWARYR